MGYFSELLITEMERQEQLFGCDSIADDSYPTQVSQMLWKLEELRDSLKDFIFWDNLFSIQQGRPLRNWKIVYKEWPEYCSDRRTDLIYYPISYFSYENGITLEEILLAIAGAQKKLFFYGYNAETETEKGQKTDSSDRTLEGQLVLQLAA